MDTCFLTTGIPATACDTAFARLRAGLSQYGFKERRHASDEEMDDYRGALAEADARWRAFVESGLPDDVIESMDLPYRWFRAGGDIEIEGRRHIVHLFVHPTGPHEAALSVLFDTSLWDALHGDRAAVDKVVDEAVKGHLVAILLPAVECFAPAAFGLKRLNDVSDLSTRLTSDDVVQWLLAPTLDVIRRWPFQLAGVRRGAALRSEIEARRSSGRLLETTSGHLVLDLIGGG